MICEACTLIEQARFRMVRFEHYHDVHTGRGEIGLCAGLCLRTSLMYHVNDCKKPAEMVE